MNRYMFRKFFVQLCNAGDFSELTVGIFSKFDTFSHAENIFMLKMHFCFVSVSKLNNPDDSK